MKEIVFLLLVTGLVSAQCNNTTYYNVHTLIDRQKRIETYNEIHNVTIYNNVTYSIDLAFSPDVILPELELDLSTLIEQEFEIANENLINEIQNVYSDVNTDVTLIVWLIISALVVGVLNLVLMIRKIKSG